MPRDERRRRAWRRRAIGLGSLCVALSLPGIAAAAPAVVGRVLSVHGAAYAKAPGEPRRILKCKDPIFEGDRVMTQENSALGIDSGPTYVRLGENTALAIGALAARAPRVDLLRGHARLVDPSGDVTGSAELLTPGLRVARTGGDVDGLVFSEKAGTVSMVCTAASAVSVERRGRPDEALVATPGGCVVGKPREALYAAQATHEKLAVLMADACDELPPVAAAGRFTPTSVALGPAFLGGGRRVPPPPADVLSNNGIAEPCSPVCTTPPASSPGLSTNFPFVPPVLPGGGAD